MNTHEQTISDILDTRSPRVRAMDEAKESAVKHIRKRIRNVDETTLDVFLRISKTIEREKQTFDLSDYLYRCGPYDVDKGEINKYFIAYCDELTRLNRIVPLENPLNQFTLYRFV